jgi:hypothetical protein
LGDVVDAKEKLLAESGEAALNGQRIAFLVENSYDYVGAQFWPIHIDTEHGS